MELTAEAEWIDLGQFTLRTQQLPERSIYIFGDTVSGLIQKSGYILIAVRHVVIGVSVVGYADRDIQTDGFRLPCEGHQQGIVVRGIVDRDQFVIIISKFIMLVHIPVVESEQSLGGDFLLNPAAHVVVGHFHQCITAFGTDQAVFSVPCIEPAIAGGQHIAVGVVGRLIAVDCRVLVQQVAGVTPGVGAFRRSQAVADSVIGIRESRIVAGGSRYLTLLIVAVAPRAANRIGDGGALILVVQRIGDFRNIVQVDSGQA